MEQIIETWLISNRMNLYLLSGIKEDWLSDVSASKGRTVGEQLGHLHNVRLMWLKEAAPYLLEGLSKIEKGTATIALLNESFLESAEAIGKLLEEGIEKQNIKGFKPHTIAFLGYIIAHEAHHRGQVILSLKQAGRPVSKKILFGLWEWGSRAKEIDN